MTNGCFIQLKNGEVIRLNVSTSSVKMIRRMNGPLQLGAQNGEKRVIWGRDIKQILGITDQMKAKLDSPPPSPQP